MSAEVLVHEDILWHDAECGGYGDDLALWSQLAERAAGDVLDLGCGTGRVALDLAARGHHVWGLDLEPHLVEALAARAAERGLEVEALAGDCRRLDLGRRFALAIAPMQLVQVLGGMTDRRAFLVGVREHLEDGGLLAAAIVEGVPPAAFVGGDNVTPDVREASGTIYSSLPLGTTIRDGALEIRRLRQVIPPAGDIREHVHTDRLDILDAGALEAEAGACGLEAAGRLDIPAGADHVGSTVVVLERRG